jgi:hypothetical protein
MENGSDSHVNRNKVENASISDSDNETFCMCQIAMILDQTPKVQYM